MMNAKQNRFAKGIAAALAAHIAAAVLIGFIGLRFAKPPEQIIEITIGGGGGGGSSAQPQAAESQSSPLQSAIDDIFENKKPQPEVKQQIKQTPKVNKPAAENVKQQPAATSAGQSTGEGTGSGSGKGSGSGSGEGSGTGSGKGSGNGPGVGEGTAVTPPRLVKMQKPKYPPAARKNGIEGVTMVRLLVTENGTVEAASLSAGSGNAELDNAALNAVYSYRFTAAKDSSGLPIRCYITVPVRFNIDE